MRKIIVTGSEGFIGKQLVKRLEAQGDEVIRVDRRSKVGAISVKDFFDTVPDLSDADMVYHLAAQTSVFNTMHSLIVRDNIEAFMSVCDACQRTGVKLVYASSSTANHCNTTSLYGISKRFDEEYARCYCPNATGVRLHNVYGADPRQGTLLWTLVNSDSVTLYNNGENTRHFTYIDDAVSGLIEVSTRSEQLVNVANPQLMSTNDFSRIVALYKPLEIILDNSKRQRDNLEQSLDRSYYCINLPYKSVEDGIATIFKQ